MNLSQAAGPVDLRVRAGLDDPQAPREFGALARVRRGIALEALSLRPERGKDDPHTPLCPARNGVEWVGLEGSPSKLLAPPGRVR